MPFPFIVGAAMVGSAAFGIYKHCEAQEKLNQAEAINNDNIARTKRDEEKTQQAL